MSTRLRQLLFVTLGAAFVLAGCGEENPSTTTAPVDEPDYHGDPTDLLVEEPTPQDEEFLDHLRPGDFTVCKVAEGADIVFPFETLAQGPGVPNAQRYQPYVELGDGDCEVVYRAPEGPNMPADTVTIMELVPEGWRVDRVAIWNIAETEMAGLYDITFHEYGPGTYRISGEIDANKQGCVAIFYNSRIPEEEGECTRTPGYWKTHPDEWPVESVTVGGTTYTKEEAIEILWMPVAGDKTKTIFASLVAAMLNEAHGSNTSCLGNAIDDANEWFESHPVGSGVSGGSDAWHDAEGIHTLMDDYNNGRLDCADHCEDGDEDEDDGKVVDSFGSLD